ncbi:flagellar motor switch phosphatase FliY [Effusibacillus pohliae]|uniref:flagellar motor switch phosphatase FliY n=1 Tax=Effusibacillus pohliae TaxID=232270 RepID=UPI0003628C71|nr:flagellar motor switch phosphatase FliY [Effusibacillus pohliae]
MTGNDFLSQEEIDALLRQAEAGGPQQPKPTDLLSDFEKDALGEIGNISFGTAATALSTLLRQKVEITTPAVSVIDREQLQNDLPIPHVVIKVDYTDGFVGSNVLAIRTGDAQVIADLMLGGDGRVEPGELNELHMSAVAEAMNQMMGSAATSMSTIFNMVVNITPPSVDIFTLDRQHANALFPTDEVLVKIAFRLLVGDLIDSQIMNLVPISFAKTMLAKLTGNDEPAEAAATAAQEAPVATPQPAMQAPEPMAAAPQPSFTSGSVSYQQAASPLSVSQPPHPGAIPPAGDPLAHRAVTDPVFHGAAGYHSGYGPGDNPVHGAVQDRALHGATGYSPAYGSGARSTASAYPPGGRQHEAPTVNVQPVQFAAFDPVEPNVIGSGNLNLLLDVPLQVTVELGRTRKQIREILELGPGSILELDKLAGEPVDILVNNKLIAKGEVVVIDENFGVRVTDILTPAERISKLQ